MGRKKELGTERAREKQGKRAVADGKQRKDLQVAGVVGSVVLALYAVLLFKASGDAAPLPLSAADPETLKEVFSGGEPWVVWCSDAAGLDLAATHSIIEQAAPLLGGAVRVGVLDCSALLPSGKSTYEKLKLNSTESPVMFFSANGQKPHQVRAKHAKSVKSLVEYATSKSTPLLRRPTSTAMLQQHCLSAKWCALVLTDGRLSEPYKSDVDELVGRFRNVQFNALDASKYRLGTSPKVLRKGEPTTENPSMVLIHRLKTAKGKSVTLARVHRGDLMATGGAGDVLEEALLPKENGRPGGMGWVALSAAPSITYRRGTGSQLPSSSADSSAEQETSTWDEADSVQAELNAKRKAKIEKAKAEKDESNEGEQSSARAEREAAREERKEQRARDAAAAAAATEEAEELADRERALSREKRRRQEMDREAYDSLGIEEVDPEEVEDHEGGGTSDSGLADSDEVIMLDDDWDDDEL